MRAVGTAGVGWLVVIATIGFTSPQTDADDCPPDMVAVDGYCRV